MLTLLELHCKVTFGISNLRQDVEQLVNLTCYFFHYSHRRLFPETFSSITLP
jgi:hypothetical protein